MTIERILYSVPHTFLQRFEGMMSPRATESNRHNHQTTQEKVTNVTNNISNHMKNTLSSIEQSHAKAHAELKQGQQKFFEELKKKGL